MDKLKRNPLFHSATEALMVILLVLLFASPFVVATALTPGYRQAQSRAENRPEPGYTASVDKEKSQEVLGVETEKAVKMLVPTAMENVVLESYATSKTEGLFRYRVVFPEEEKVLIVKNDGSFRVDFEVWVSDLLQGEAYLGTQKYTGKTKISLEPGKDISITVKPEEIGQIDIQVTVL